MTQGSFQKIRNQNSVSKNPGMFFLRRTTGSFQPQNNSIVALNKMTDRELFKIRRGTHPCHDVVLARVAAQHDDLARLAAQHDVLARLNSQHIVSRPNAAVYH